jgi:hypothetical protein
MKFDGSNWVNVGSPGFSAGQVLNTSIAINSSGSPYVVYADEVDSGSGWPATVMEYGFPNNVNNINNYTASLTAFPNPNHGSFTINITSPTNENAIITITNMFGETVKELTTTTNTETPIQLSAPPGIYFISSLTTLGRQSAKVMLW